MSYIGLDQPGVEPSGDDTSGINRSHVRRELFIQIAILLHARIQRGVRIPPLGKSQSYRVSYQYWSGFHGKSQSYQDRIQCLATIGLYAKRHLNGVSLVGW